MTPDPRIDWLRVTIYTALLLTTCAITTGAGWLIERMIAAYGPWVVDHADVIFAVVLTVCVIALAVIGIGQRAKKDNASW